jgi:hypothetical protein
MAPLVAVGVGLPEAFRVVNLIGFALLLFGVRSLAHCGTLTPRATVIALALVALHMTYFLVVVVTPDALSATPFLWTAVCLAQWQRSRRARYLVIGGVLGGLCYYVKAILLPVLLLAVPSVFVLWASRRQCGGREAGKGFSLMLGVALVVVAPWIMLLSFKYQRPLITAQVLHATHPYSRYDYSPRNYEVYTRPDRGRIEGEMTVLPKDFDSRGARVLFGLKHLMESVRGVLFGPDALPFYLLLTAAGALIALFHAPSAWVPVVVFAVVQCGVHLYAWGAYIRYFFPSLPLLHLFFALAVERGVAHISTSWLRRAFAGGVVVVLLATATTTLSSAYNDWRERGAEDPRGIIECVAMGQYVREGVGVFTGNSGSIFPPLVAYHLGQEFWSPLVSSLNEPVSVIEQRLLTWKVVRVLWFGDPWPTLDAVSSYRRSGPLRCGGKTVFVYAPQVEFPQGD